MAETLGDAYIRVHADTSLMAGEIRRATSQFGNKAGNEFSKNFNKTVKDKIKVSREIRLQEMATTRLLSKVSTAVPAPESLRSIKARNAVNKHWHPDAG